MIVWILRRYYYVFVLRLSFHFTHDTDEEITDFEI